MAREAPVARVVERPAGLWLELTGSPFDVPDEALERLEGFLAPILPTVEQVLEADGEVSRPVPAGAGAGRATRADGYADYGGPPVALEWLWNEEGLDLTFNVHFASRPVGEAERAFLRAVRSWYDAGVRGRYRPRGALRGEGVLHGRTEVDWDGDVARWRVDVGDSDGVAAVQELARRLGGWAAKWGCPITVLRVGREAP